MTFEEWVERSIPMTSQEKTFAYFAWKAATETEREACAKVCEEQAKYPECPERAGYCADAIRMRSNK